jgi:hypothetical protein
MHVSAVQFYHRPSSPLCFFGGVVVNFGCLNKPSGHSVPICHWDGVFDPLNRKPPQATFEICENQAVVRKSTEADQSLTLRVATKPLRPNREKSRRSWKSLNKFAQRWPYRLSKALYRWDMSIDDDYGLAANLTRQISNQGASGAVAHKNRPAQRGGDQFEQTRCPITPGRRYGLISQNVWYLSLVARFPQVVRRSPPA